MTKDEALKLALEALEIEQSALAYEHGKVEHIENAITAIKEALAQPEQEPVMMDNGKTAPPENWGEISREEVIKREIEMLKRIAKAELTLDGLTSTEFALRELYEFQEATGCDTAVEFKTNRKPLTDKQILDAYDVAKASFKRSQQGVRGQMLTSRDLFDWHFARAIEAAHGIKGKNT